MDIQLSKGSLAAIFSGENVEFPKLQILQLRRVNAFREHYQLILSDGIHFICLAMLGVHLNILISSGEIQKLTVIKVKKYLLKPLNEKRKIICILDLDIVCKGNQIRHIIGSPTRLVCSTHPEERTEEIISEKMKSTKSSIEHHEIGSSEMIFSTSPSMSSISKEKWVTFKPETQLMGDSHMKILSTSEIMQSVSHENTKIPEVSMGQMNTLEMVSTPQGKLAEKCFPIFSLTPYLHRWTIEAWVSDKSPVYCWKNRQGKTLSIDLIDGSGEIRAIAFNECCDTFCEMLEVNKSYYISNCKVVPANRKFTSIKYEYQLIFTEHTKINPSNANTENMPSPYYNFKSIPNICTLPLDECIDILGVCESLFDEEYIHSRNSSNDIKKQDVILVDSTSTEVKLTLWDAEVGKITQECLHQIIAIRGAKISEYMGTRNLTLAFSSSIKINPDIPLAHELRHWYNSNGWIQLSGSISTSCTDLRDKEDCPYKTLWELEMYSLGGSTYNFTCPAIVLILKQAYILYKACPALGCNRKLTELDDSFWCDNCEKELTSFSWRILLQAKIGDFTNQVWVTCFHEESERLLCVTADELARLKDTENKEKYYQVFQNVIFKYFNFTIKRRLHTYKGKERITFVAVRVRKISYIEHNRKLIRELRSIKVTN